MNKAPGTGYKDAVIIRDMLRRNPNLYYVPVDMSAEMLRLAVRGPVRETGLPAAQILPIQLDFSSQTSLRVLWAALNQLIGDEPVLFSLLGNTLANFDSDAELLRTLTTQVRRQDRFLLEAATTDRLDEDMARAAALEYRQSRSFCEFATSALLRHTDLHIGDTDHLVFAGSVEDDKSLLVKVIYQNQSGRAMRFALLSDRTSVLMPAGDTIRMYLTRKYVAAGLKSLLADCHLSSLASTQRHFVGDRGRPRFGIDLMVVSVDTTPQAHGTTSVNDLWG